MLKKKVFIVPAIFVTMNTASVFGKDIAIMPAQEAVSGHEVIYGHTITGERRMPVPAEYQAAKTVTIPAEFETIKAISQPDTSESLEVIPAEFDTSNK